MNINNSDNKRPGTGDKNEISGTSRNMKTTKDNIINNTNQSQLEKSAIKEKRDAELDACKSEHKLASISQDKRHKKSKDNLEDAYEDKKKTIIHQFDADTQDVDDKSQAYIEKELMNMMINSAQDMKLSKEDKEMIGFDKMTEELSSMSFNEKQSKQQIDEIFRCVVHINILLKTTSCSIFDNQRDVAESASWKITVADDLIPKLNGLFNKTKDNPIYSTIRVQNCEKTKVAGKGKEQILTQPIQEKKEIKRGSNGSDWIQSVSLVKDLSYALRLVIVIKGQKQVQFTLKLNDNVILVKDGNSAYTDQKEFSNKLPELVAEFLLAVCWRVHEAQISPTIFMTNPVLFKFQTFTQFANDHFRNQIKEKQSTEEILLQGKMKEIKNLPVEEIEKII